MNRVPNEVVDLIAENCDFPSLKPFRLTCKRFAVAAARPLFEIVHVAVVESSFEKLVNISNDPVYAKYVRKLYFSGDTLLNITWSEWDKYMPKNFASAEESATVYRRYREILREGQYWDVNTCGAKLAQVFLRTPYLSSVTLSFGSGVGRWPVWKNLEKEARCYTLLDSREWFLPCNDGKALATIMRGMALGADLASVKGSKLSVQHMTFHISSMEAWCPRSVSGAAAERYLRHARLGPSTITHFTIASTDPFGCENCGHELVHPNSLKDFAAFLKRMENLECLIIQTLQTDLNGYDDASYDYLSHLSRTQMTWPRLRTLKLGIPTTSTSLVNLLQLHKNTLRVLYLKDVTLLAGSESWKTIIPEMSSFLRLGMFRYELLIDAVQSMEDLEDIDGFHDQLEEFMEGKGPCPSFDQVAYPNES